MLRLAGIPVTSPEFWVDERRPLDVLKGVFRSTTEEEIPLFEDRVHCLREASQILCDVCIGLFLMLYHVVCHMVYANVNKEHRNTTAASST